MRDLNILEMMNGAAPGYVEGRTVNPQRLAVLLMVSEKDAGRTYGGGLAAMAGEANDPEAVSLEVSSILDEAVSWMQTNSDDVPAGFTASVENAFADLDGLAVTIKAGEYDEQTPVNLTIG